MCGSGCARLSPVLQQVLWPPQFWSNLPRKYDGSVDPLEFLQTYATTIQAVGRDEKVMANYFPIALTSRAWSWMMSLPENSVSSWKDMCRQFVMYFRGAPSYYESEVGPSILQQYEAPLPKGNGKRNRRRVRKERMTAEAAVMVASRPVSIPANGGPR